MALMDDVKKNPGVGIFIGIGAVLLAPVLIPIIASAARPLARSAIKGGMLLYDKGKEKMAEAGEIFDDLVAEVRDEVQREYQEAYAFATAAEAEMEQEPESGGEGEASGEGEEGDDAS